MNTSPHNRSFPVGPLVAAVGALLLIVSLFLDWYEGDIEAFAVYEFLDLLLVLLALATIASLAGGLGLVRPARSPVVSLAVSLFTVYVVLSQVLNDPPVIAFNDEIGKEIGIWLALGGAGLMAIGSLLAFGHISLAFEPRGEPRRGGRTEGEPLDTEGETERESLFGGRAREAARADRSPGDAGSSAPRPSDPGDDPDPTRPLGDPDPDEPPGGSAPERPRR